MTDGSEGNGEMLKRRDVRDILDEGLLGIENFGP